MVRITTIFDLHRWYTQSDGQKWFTLILFFGIISCIFSHDLSSSHLSHQSLQSSCSLITHQKSSSLIHILPSPLQSSSLITYSILISGSLKLAVCRHGFNLTTSAQVRKPPLPWPRLLLLGLFLLSFSYLFIFYFLVKSIAFAHRSWILMKGMRARGEFWHSGDVS